MKPIQSISCLTCVRWLMKMICALCMVAVAKDAVAHPMPNSVILLNIQKAGIAVELQLPLSELQLAFGNDVDKNTETLVKRLGPELKEYILSHVHPVGSGGKIWVVSVNDLLVQPAEQSTKGLYQELTVHLWLQPSDGENTRSFILNYDVIIHQLVTHSAIVKIQNDWNNGISSENPVEIGVIALDVRSNTIPPLKIDMDDGSIWRGFKSLVLLGIHHISEGTDHLLFLLALLLPAPLLVANTRWSSFGGARYSLLRLLKIVTAFTIGHSVTLLVGAFGWLKLPAQPVEVIIALSILISAVHAIRPIFAGKEMAVAGFFGLVHGLAFASIITGLNLDAERIALSILGFNLGIELMQVLVIALTMPWLILISQTPYYSCIRIGGAGFAIIASLAWIFERTLDTSTPVSSAVETLADYAVYMVGILALLSVAAYLLSRVRT